MPKPGEDADDNLVEPAVDPGLEVAKAVEKDEAFEPDPSVMEGGDS